MAFSYITYNGGQDSYQIPFPYIDKSHIQVTLNGEITEYEWESDTTVSLLQPNDSSDWVAIKRITPRDRRLVDFKDGSILTEQNLDTSAEQLLYLLQEAYDNMVDALGFDEEAGAYDAQGFRIMNVGQAESDRDVFTIEDFKVNYLPDIRDDFVPAITEFTETAEQARDTAVSAKEGAVTAEASALNYSAEAAISADNALDSAIDASQSATEAFGAAAPAWDSGTVYNFPDVVAFTNGHTYRCIGTNITSAPNINGIDNEADWTRITVAPDGFFEVDESGDLMPMITPIVSEYWMLDENGDIMTQEVA